MSKWTSAFLLSFLIAPLASAKPAVFRDSVLTIDEAVVVAGSSYQYFKHVQLRVLDSGQLALVNAEPRTLAQIKELNVAVLSTEPVQVELVVTGDLSDPCVQLEPVSVSRVDRTFHVVLAETQPDPAATCIAQIVPYQVTIPLDVSNLSAGNYLVVVNGENADFDLE